ncbi:MAG TPA: sugar ABC transporter ATP-binding protein [Paludibaculum sp.]
MSKAVLEAREVSLQYPGTLALDGVTFRLRAGRVSALIGENGAGKSTLVKVLGGVESPTRGSLLLDGEPIALRSVRDADSLGIGMIHQELNLCPNLSVAENIFLARELTTHGLLDSTAQHHRAEALLARLEHPIDPEALVGDLPLGQQQIVEIAKALARDVRVLMMDEPTSALSPAEIAILFRIIRDLTARGVAILYISHRLEELLEIADEVAVLRDGRLVAESEARVIDTRWIVEQMTGRTSAVTDKGPQAPAQAEILRAEGLSLVSASGKVVLQNASFSLRAGEILGFYGLMGAGRTELVECVMGLHQNASGSVVLNGQCLDGQATSSRISAGLALVPEDRQGAGLVQTLSVCGNMTLASLRQCTRGGWLLPGLEQAAAGKLVTDLHIRTAGIQQNIGSLSGGNQQKVVLAKCLLTSPRVLLLDEPTRGVDVGAKREIHEIVRKLAESGMGIIVVSSELEEMLAVADRIIVLSRGVITAEFDARQATGAALATAASVQPELEAGTRQC